MDEVDATKFGDESRKFEPGKVLVSSHGKGKELAEMLMRELGIDKETVRKFSVTFEVGECVMVQTEHYARERIGS